MDLFNKVSREWKTLEQNAERLKDTSGFDRCTQVTEQARCPVIEREAFSGTICSERLTASVAKNTGPALSGLIVATVRDSATVLQFLHFTDNG
jgi:hypothetical protein